MESQKCIILLASACAYLIIFSLYPLHVALDMISVILPVEQSLVVKDASN